MTSINLQDARSSNAPCTCRDFNWHKDPGPDGKHHEKCAERLQAERMTNALNKKTLDNFFSKL